jgi:thymidylate kinase
MTSIVLIAGSPASGKSTVAKLLAMRAKRGVYVCVDSLRDMVLGGVVHPGANWSPTLIEQLRLARANAIAIAANYALAGFEVFIDDFWDPQSLLNEYEPLVRMYSPLRILLHPTKATAVSRNSHRFAHDEAMRAAIEQGVHAVYADFATRLPWFSSNGWIVLDNTQETPDATARRIALLANANA